MNCDVPGHICPRRRYGRKPFCKAHYERQRIGRPDWAAPLIIRGTGRPVRSLGKVRVELVARLDSLARAYRTNRSLLLERILTQHFAREADE